MVKMGWKICVDCSLDIDSIQTKRHPKKGMEKMEQDNTTGAALEPDVIDLEDLPDIDID